MLETRFSVPQSPDEVWSVLIDYPSYSRWNTFMREASGVAIVGERLNITLCPASGGKTNFSPKLLVVDKGRELRWRGTLIADALLHGEHYWLFSRTAAGGTDIVHGEGFKGLIAPFFNSDKYNVDFKRMDRDTAAEVARRFAPPARTA